MTIYEFDRYIKGQLMAEGVTIEKQPTLELAMVAAVRIASKGPNGEAPVLVLRREREPQPDALALVAAAYRDAAGVLDDPGDNAATAALGRQLCCNGQQCGCHGADVGAYLQYLIKQQTPSDATAALAAIERASYERGVREAAARIADTCPYADVPGGNCTPDTFDEGTSAAYEAILALLTQEGR